MIAGATGPRPTAGPRTAVTATSALCCARLFSPLIGANNASGLPARLSPDRNPPLAGKTLAQAWGRRALPL